MKRLTMYSYEEQVYRLKNYFKFLVVRHPFVRLLSVYKDAIIKESFLSEFGKYLKVNSSSYVKNITLVQFLEMVYRTSDALPNNHWKTYEMMCHPCAVNYDHVIYMESIHDDLDPVLDWMTDHGERPTLQGSNVTGLDFRRQKQKISKTLQGIDSDVIKGLIDIYSRDSAVFGYTWNDETEIGCDQCVC